MVLRTQGTPSSVSETSASKRFQRYAGEKVKTVRKPNVKNDHVLQQLVKAWNAYGLDPEAPGGHGVDRYIEAISGLSILKELNYSAADIEKFTLLLPDFQNEKFFSEKAGLFLSILINKGNDENYIVHTQNLDLPIEYLGYENRKHITVKGDAGDNLGYLMHSGIIIVEGNVGEKIGHFMEDGEIIVNGNVGHSPGGLAMYGGKIHIEGDCGKFDVDFGCGDDAKIYHKGKLITGDS